MREPPGLENEARLMEADGLSEEEGRERETGERVRGKRERSRWCSVGAHACLCICTCT